MSDEAAFLHAICADPADDTARLVFADFLQEQGGNVETAWALFIRAHIRLVAGVETSGDVTTVRRLGNDYWQARFAGQLGAPAGAGVALEEWERGFPNGLAAGYMVLKRDWALLVNRVPFRHLRVGGMEDEAVEDLVAWPRLERLTALHLTTWDGTLVPRALGARAVAALAGCPALAGLKELCLSFPDVTERVADLILKSRYLAELEVLTLRTHENPSERARERLCARFGECAVQ
jgi:uncharacterized protein (TIGR02996 family)